MKPDIPRELVMKQARILSAFLDFESNGAHPSAIMAAYIDMLGRYIVEHAPPDMTDRQAVDDVAEALLKNIESRRRRNP